MRLGKPEISAFLVPLHPAAPFASRRKLDFAAVYGQFPAPFPAGDKVGMRTYLSFETSVAEIDARTR